MLFFDKKNQLFLTTNEMGSPYYRPEDERHAIRTTATQPWTLQTYINGSDSYYGWWQVPLVWKDVAVDEFPSSAEDHRILGEYLKVWYSSKSQRTVEGAGQTSAEREAGGPGGSYDPIQQSPADRNAGIKFPAFKNSGVLPIDCSISNDDRAPSTLHRPKTIWGETNKVPTNTAAAKEVYVAAYSQGVRVLDLANFIDPGVGFHGSGVSNPADPSTGVIERAYFDPFPTLNYDIASKDFYATKTLEEVRVPNYFLGTYDVTPDVRGVPSYSDENFVYSTGLPKPDRYPYYNGGFMVMRYFRDEVGGLISGYTPSASDPNDNNEMAFRVVNLQGTFKVSRTTTIASGASVHVLDGSVFNLPTSNSANKITVNGNLYISTRGSSGRATLNVPIEVSSTGCLIVEPEAHVDFTKSITVARGGQLVILGNTNAVFAANVRCDGVFKVEGIAGQPAVLQAAVDASRFVTGTTTITMLGDLSQPTQSLLQLKYGNFKNIFIYATNVRPNQTYVAELCKFEADDIQPNKTLLYIKSTNYRLLRATHRHVKINDCEFRGPQQYPAQQLTGLLVSGWRSIIVQNSEFSALKLGTAFWDATSATFSDNTVTGCTRGVWTAESRTLICKNSFNTNEYAIQSGSQNHVVSHFDNTFTNQKTAVFASSSGAHYFRGNDFEQYCYGIESHGVWPYLKNRYVAGLYPNDWIVYGRNHFTQSSPSPWSCGLYPGTTDIYLSWGDRVFMDCGYNEMSANSTWHVWGQANNGSLDVTKNWWRNGSGLGVRTNLNYFGTDLDQDQASTASCSLLVSDDGCTLGCAGNGGGWIGIYDIWSDLYNEYVSSRQGMYDTSSSNEACIINYMWETMEAARILDSTHRYQQLVEDYEAIAEMTRPKTRVRSTALLLKAHAYEQLMYPDSATMTYRRITDSMATSIDSLAAGWGIQALQVEAASETAFDSMLLAYKERVLADMRRMTTTGGPAAKGISEPLSVTAPTSFDFTMSEPVPNPAGVSTSVTLNASHSVFARVVLINVLGNEIEHLFEGELVAGPSTISVSTANLPPGIYIVRAEAGGVLRSGKFSVSK